MTAEQVSAQLAASAPTEGASLTELQNWMVQLIGHRKAIHKHQALSEAANYHFGGNSRLSPAEQINIYRVQFWLRHTAILIDHFQGLSRWLGQKRWQNIAEGYLQQATSNVFALSDLGHQMPEYLAQLPAFYDQQLCIDMATLEWAYQEAFIAADDEPLSLKKIQAIAPEAWATACFSVSASLNLLTVHYPVADLRRSLRSSPKEVERGQLPVSEQRHLVVYRRERVLYDKELSAPAFLLLEQLAKNVPLITACEIVVALAPKAEQILEDQLMHWFKLWGQLGWITDVRAGM